MAGVRADHKQRQPRGQDRYWTVIMELHRAGHKEFTSTEVWRKCNGHRSTVQSYMRRLAKAGILKKAESGAYSVVRTSRDTPRVRKDGSIVTAGKGNENMWRTMRMLGRFTAHDLAVAASTEEHPVKESTAEKYCLYLCRAGYLLNRAAEKQTPNYHLLKSKVSGPKPPQIQRIKQVYDPNTNTVVWPKPEVSK